MSRPAERKHLAAAVIGNALDWYDFTIYAYLTPIIATQFFPRGSDWTAILSTLAIFAVSFFVRPLGGIVIGHYADLIGRKRMMVLVIGLMSAGTALICIAPTYAMVGIAAPLIITVARILQGLAAGGEFASATTFLIEHAPPGRRGFYGGWQLSGQGGAILLAGLSATLLSAVLTPPQLESWGWRLPFLLGLVVGPIGLYLLASASDTPEFLASAARSERRSPLRSALANDKWNALLGVGLVMGGSAVFYVLFIFMPTYAMRVLKLGREAAFIAPAVAGLAVTVICPLSGALSDRTGRKPLMVGAAAVLLAIVFPAFLWLGKQPSLATLATIELAFGILIGVYGGPFSSAMAELFPVTTRATALSIGYNIGVAAFGGSAPFIVAWLIAWTASPLVPGYYVAACLLCSLVAAAIMPRRA